MTSPARNPFLPPRQTRLAAFVSAGLEVLALSTMLAGIFIACLGVR